MRLIFCVIGRKKKDCNKMLKKAVKESDEEKRQRMNQMAEEFNQEMEATLVEKILPWDVIQNFWVLDKTTTFLLAIVNFTTLNQALKSMKHFKKHAKERPIARQPHYVEFFHENGTQTNLLQMPKDQAEFDTMIGDKKNVLQSRLQRHREWIVQSKCHTSVFFVFTYPSLVDNLVGMATCWQFFGGGSSTFDWRTSSYAKHDDTVIRQSAETKFSQEDLRRIGEEWAKASQAFGQENMKRDIWSEQFQVCRFCHKTKKTDPNLKFGQCGKCKSARYCSKECQTAHWKASHRDLCDSECVIAQTVMRFSPLLP
jgi:hypothetical protein